MVSVKTDVDVVTLQFDAGHGFNLRLGYFYVGCLHVLPGGFSKSIHSQKHAQEAYWQL